MIDIRPVSPSDGPSLGAIQVAIRPQLSIDFPEPHDPIARGELWQKYLEAPPVEDFRGWVAEDKGEVVAFLIAGRDTTDRDAVTIFDLYVTPEHQRFGIGRRLLEAAIAELRASGHIHAVLWTAEANEPWRAFYERLGWRAEDTKGTEQGSLVRYRIDL